MKNNWFSRKIRMTRQLATYLKLIMCNILLELTRVQLLLVTIVLIGVLSVRYEYAAGLALVEIASIMCMAYGVVNVILAMTLKQYSKLWVAIQSYLILRAFTLGIELPSIVEYSKISNASLPTVIMCSAIAIFVPKYLRQLRYKVLFEEVLNKYYLYYDGLFSIPRALNGFYKFDDETNDAIKYIETKSINEDYLNYVSISNVSATNSIRSNRNVFTENAEYEQNHYFSLEYDFYPFGKSRKFHHKIMNLKY